MGLEVEEQRGSLHCLGRLLAGGDAQQLHPLQQQVGALGAGADHLRVIPALRSSSPRVREVPGAAQGGCQESLDPKDRLHPWVTAGTVLPSKAPGTPPDFTLLASFAMPACPCLSSGDGGSVCGEHRPRSAGRRQPQLPARGQADGVTESPAH